MTVAAVGISTEPNTARAALAAAADVRAKLDGDADWAIVFASDEHQAYATSLQETLCGALGTPYIAGCSAAGLVAPGCEIEEGPAVGVLAVRSDRLKATPFFFRDQGDNGLTAATQLGQRMLGSRDSSDLMLVWPDPFTVRPDRLICGVDAVLPGLPLVGGAASGRGESTWQFCGTDEPSQGISGMRLAGGLTHVVGVTQGCAPLGEPLRVTSAHDNLILEVDGRPAYDVLEELAPDGMLSDPTSAMHYLFVGLAPQDDQYLIRNIVTLDSQTGVVAIADRVAEGAQIVFALRQPESAQADLERMLDRVSPEATGLNYRFGMYFNCLARGSRFYGEPHVDARAIQRRLPDLPWLGFFGNAEIGPLRGENRLFTYSGVLLLVAESET